MIDTREKSVRLGDFLRKEDVQPVRYVFLPAAPPVSPEYPPVLAKIAHLVNKPDFRRRLDELESADEFLQLLADAGV